MSEVNFSDRTPSMRDPHSWTEKTAQVMLDGRVLYTVTVWLCERCQAVTPLPPRFLRSDDPVMRACVAPGIPPC